MPYGGLAAIHQLVGEVGLPGMIDSELDILKRVRPYQDSEHVLNIAYNIFCGGRVLDDIKVRRNDAAFLDMLAARHPRPDHGRRLLSAIRRRGNLAAQH